MSKRVKWLDRAVVIAPFHFTLCTSEKQYRKVLDHLKIPPGERPEFLASWHAGATLHWFENRRLMAVTGVLCLRRTKAKSREQVHALLVHEAVHMWQELKRIYGEMAPSHEFEAYAIQSLAQALMQDYKRQAK